MKPPFFQSTQVLKQGDFFLLGEIFQQLVLNQLPVKANVLFWNRQWEFQQGEVYAGSVKNWQSRLDTQCESLEPGYLLDMLVIPLVVDDRPRVAVLVQGIDPALVKKMDHEWLVELRDSIQRDLELKRQEYVDSVTGLYNNLLLTTCLEQNAHLESSVLFLVGIGNRTRKVTVSLMKIVQAGRFIETVANGTVFYLGGNIFGVLYADMSRHESLGLAHRLLSLLKREGQHNAHIGISRLGRDRQEEGRGSVLSECWQALEAAERRGPYSLCEASYLRNSALHPLARPSMEILSQLRRKWIGLKRFGLILLRVDNPESCSSADTTYLPGLLSSHLPDGCFYVSVSWDEGYIFIPKYTQKQTVQVARKFGKILAKSNGCPSVSQGVCHWPTLNYSKTEMTVNCRKALMHGSFFGPGTVTVFDHISLNVSGDFYFDEGDYRQAVRDYRLGYQLASDDINLMNSLGVALIELNRLREAIDYFDRVLEREPENFMAIVNRGFALRMTGNDNEALACFERASKNAGFRKAPVFSDISLQLGRLYCGSKEYGMAVRILEKLAQQDDGKQELSLSRLLGEAYAGLGKNKKAIMQLQRTVRLNPHDALSLSILGDLYAEEGQGNEVALSFCEQAVDIDDGPWEYWYRLAKVRHRMGATPGALAALNKCLRRNRKAADALRLAGTLYEKLGETKKSERMFQRVRLLQPGPNVAFTVQGNNMKKKSKRK